MAPATPKTRLSRSHEHEGRPQGALTPQELGKKAFDGAKEDKIRKGALLAYMLADGLYFRSMLRYLHQLSAVLFYVLGLSFFLGYILARNGILADSIYWWLANADLPLLLSGLLYGGLSVFLSIRNEEKRSTGLFLFIALPVLLIFGTVLAINFLPIFS